jgi:hypothetical protein
MNVLVLGSIRLSNGDPPLSASWAAHGGGKSDTEELEFNLNIVAGRITVEYLKGFQNEGVNVDEVFRTTRHLIDNSVSKNILFEGIGLQYVLEQCRLATGDVVKATPDQAPPTGEETQKFDDIEFYNVLGGDDKLRFAIRDFNAGLLDRENCPLLFYRAIETLAKDVIGKDDLDSSDWKAYHTQVGTNRENMKLLEELNKRHRHGTHTPFNREQHLEMMKATKYFLLRSTALLVKRKSKA